MALARCTRTVDATLEAVWALVEDPHNFPRWWPDVKRMEEVHDDRWTQVFMTRKGRAVRADFNLLESEAPGPGGDPPGRRVWEQEVKDTPFERVLAESITEIVVEPDGPGTLISLSVRQRLRGYSRAGGGLLLRRASREKLSQALEVLARAVG